MFRALIIPSEINNFAMFRDFNDIEEIKKEIGLNSEDKYLVHEINDGEPPFDSLGILSNTQNGSEKVNAINLKGTCAILGVTKSDTKSGKMYVFKGLTKEEESILSNILEGNE